MIALQVWECYNESTNESGENVKKILVLMMTLMICGCTAAQEPANEPAAACGVDETCDTAQSSEYEEFMSQDNVFVQISMQEAIDLFENKETALIYFGYPSCPWCIEALPIMNEVAESVGKEIYYVQTRDEDRNLLYTDEEKEAILSYVGEFEDRDDEGNLALFVPLVVSVKDGVAVSGNVGTVDSHDAHERRMTEEETQQLREIYQEMFKD